MSRRPTLAKLIRPRPHNAVARLRLFEAIDQARRSPVLWVVGPPGAGKTTLVATYLESARVPVLWYQVDAGDADPAAFFFHLTLAATGISAKPRLPQLAPEHLADLPDFSRRFFRQLFSKLPEGSLLILDNFQDAAESGLAVLVRDACLELPPAINLLVISRSEPPAIFAELEARAAISVLAWEALRLTLDEARAMCAARGIVEDWLVKALLQESDGWAAGLTLMLERLRRVGSGTGYLPSETRESIFNYFAALIFDQASDSARETLLALAFLPRVTPSVAQTLSGSADAGKLLEQLRRRHLFTDRRPGPEPVYQFHALFSAFLQSKAKELRTRDELVGQLHATADALRAEGELESAFDLYVQAHAWDKAAALIVANAPMLLATGRWQTLSRWIETLPDARRQDDPWLLYWLASAQAQTAPSSTAATFEAAQALFVERGMRIGRVLSLSGLLYACSIDHSDYRTIERWIDVLAADLEAPPPDLAPREELEAWGALLSAALSLRPWHPCIRSGLDRIEALLKVIGLSAESLRATASALVVASRSADMERANRLAAIVESLLEQDGNGPVDRAWALFQLAHQRFLRADYEASLRFFDRTWSVAEENGLKAVLTAALTYRFMVDFRLQDRAAVDASMRRIRALPQSGHAFSRALFTCYEARHAQVMDEPQVAADHAERAHAEVLKVCAGFHEICYGMIHGEILLAAGRIDRAKALIARSRELLERCEVLSNFRGSLALIESWVAEQEGREQDSRQLLREALRCSTVGYGWCQMRYVDTTCAHMLRVALERNIEPEAAKRLIRIFRLKPRESEGENWPWPLRVHVLGRFEVIVNDAVLEFARKTPKKALALLKALVVLGPREVAEEQLVDLLWPDEEGDAGHRALSVTLLRLRRVLGDNEFIRQQGGKLSIDRQRCWVDAWAFERRLAQTPIGPAAVNGEPHAQEPTLLLYRGALLPDDNGEPWTVAVRERLRAKFIHALAGFCRQLEAGGRCDEAIAWYMKGLDADGIVEQFYQGLMRCYEKLDRRTEAIGTYRRLKRTLSATLGVPPSATTETLYNSLRSA